MICTHENCTYYKRLVELNRNLHKDFKMKYLITMDRKHKSPIADSSAYTYMGTYMDYDLYRSEDFYAAIFGPSMVEVKFFFTEDMAQDTLSALCRFLDFARKDEVVLDDGAWTPLHGFTENLQKIIEERI